MIFFLSSVGCSFLMWRGLIGFKFCWNSWSIEMVGFPFSVVCVGFVWSENYIHYNQHLETPWNQHDQRHADYGMMVMVVVVRWDGQKRQCFKVSYFSHGLRTCHIFNRLHGNGLDLRNFNSGNTLFQGPQSYLENKFHCNKQRTSQSSVPNKSHSKTITYKNMERKTHWFVVETGRRYCKWINL